MGKSEEIDLKLLEVWAVVLQHVLDGTASADEFARFQKSMADDPALRRLYREQMDAHVRLRRSGDRDLQRRLDLLLGPKSSWHFRLPRFALALAATLLVCVVIAATTAVVVSSSSATAEGRTQASLPSTTATPATSYQPQATSQSATDLLAEVNTAATALAASALSTSSAESASSAVPGDTNMNANTTKKIATALVAATAAAVTASAANTWQGPDGGDWATAANWSSGTVPTTEAIAINGPTSLVSSVNATAGELTLGGSGDVSFNFGTNTYTAGGSFDFPPSGLRFRWLSGIWNQNGKNLTLGNYGSTGTGDELLVSGPGSVLTNATGMYLGIHAGVTECGLVVSNGATLTGCAITSRGTNNYMRVYDSILREVGGKGSLDVGATYGPGFSFYATNSLVAGISFTSSPSNTFVFSDCLLTNGATSRGGSGFADGTTYVIENGSKVYWGYASMGSSEGTTAIIRSPGTFWNISGMAIYFNGNNGLLVISNGACICNGRFEFPRVGAGTNNHVRLDGVVFTNVTFDASVGVDFFATNSFILGTSSPSFGGNGVVIDSILTNVDHAAAAAGQCLAISNSSCWFTAYDKTAGSTMLIADRSYVHIPGGGFYLAANSTTIVENATLESDALQAWANASSSNAVVRLSGTNPVLRITSNNLKLLVHPTIEFVVPAQGYTAAPFQYGSAAAPAQLDGTAVLSINAKAFSNEGSGLVHLMTNTVGNFTTDFFAETNGLPAGSMLIGGKGYPYLDAQIHGTRTGFTIRICDNNVTVPYDWISNNLAKVDCVSGTAISNALVSTGANGLNRWESYALGLEPDNPSSVVLCDAKQDADARTATFCARNVAPNTNENLGVQYVLEGSPDGRTWPYSLVSATNAIPMSLPAAYSFFRFRTDVLVQ